MASTSSSTSPRSASNNTTTTNNPAADGQQSHTRTYQACLPCRRRKVRCDLGPVDNPHDPPCSRCRRESKACYFSSTRRKRKVDGSGEDGEDGEPDDYELRNGRKRLHTDDRSSSPAQLPAGVRARTMSASHPALHPPLTPGGHVANTHPLRRPGSIPLHSSDEDEQTVNNDTAAMMQHKEVFHQGDALTLLALVVERDGKGGKSIKRERSVSFGSGDKHDATAQSGIRSRRTTNTTVGSNGTLLPIATTHSGVNRTGQLGRDTQEAEAALQAALVAWSKVRFVKAGWFSPAEGMAFIDFFYQHLSPVTPITVPDFRDPAKHPKLLAEEPILAVTILAITSRYYRLPGAGTLSRGYAIHDELWRYLQQRLNRVVWAQEKFGGGFSGAGAMRAKEPQASGHTGLRTMGTIESLLLLTEWHCRSLHFPTGDDNNELMSSDEGNGDLLNSGSDFAQDVRGRNINSWLEPCWRSERMCWSLLSIAMALAFELGVFDQTTAQPNESDSMASQRYRVENLRKLLFVYITQTSGRLSLKSMLPDLQDHPLFPLDPVKQAYEARSLANQAWMDPSPSTVQQVVLYFWYEVTEFMKDGNREAFPSRAYTRQLIASGRYKELLVKYGARLTELRKRFDECDIIPPHMRHILSIEFEYNRVYCNSLALQAVVERCTNTTASNANETPTSSSTINNSTAQKDAIPAERLLKWSDGDRTFINEIIKGGHSVLQCVGDVLGPQDLLKFSPVRTFFRIISVSMVLLKCFALGQPSENAALSLKLFDRAADALRTGVVDDVHVGIRIAELLQDLTQRVRSSAIRMGKNNGTSVPGSVAPSAAASRAQTPAIPYGGPRAQQLYRANNRTTGFDQAPESQQQQNQHQQNQHRQQHRQDNDMRAIPQAPMMTPTMFQNHASHNLYGQARSQNPLLFSPGMYPPPTPAHFYEDPLHGIHQQEYDPMNLNMSIIPPSSFNYPNGEQFNTGDADGTQQPGDNNAITGNGNVDYSDWLALPIDPVIRNNGVDISEVGFFPQPGELDMLDLYSHGLDPGNQNMR